MDQTLIAAYKFFHEHGASWVGHAAEQALMLARAERRAEEEGLTVAWDEEDRPWDGDCPAPKIHVRATVMHPAYADDDRSNVAVRFPYWDRGDMPRGRTRSVLAALGGIGLDSWRDPYVRVVKAELLAEALDTLDEERDAEATRGAAELSGRATFAAGAVQS